MAVRTSHVPGFGVVVENSTTRTSHLPGFGVVAETAAEAAVGGASEGLPGYYGTTPIYLPTTHFIY